MDNSSQQPSMDQQSQQPVAQPSQQTVPPSVPRKSKLPLFILVAFVVLILVGGGVYLVKSIMSVNLTVDHFPIPSSPPSQKSPTPIPSIDPTVNWKTYTSTLYKYSIKYPSEWYATDWLWDRLNRTKTYEQKQLFINPTQTPQDAYLDGPGGIFFQVSTYDYSVANDSFWEDSSSSTGSQIIVDGEQATMKVAHKSSGYYGTFSTQIRFNHRGQEYWISWTNSDAQGTHNPKIDQILSTFKFTDKIDLKETGPDTICSFDKDCWCQAFTGAKIIPNQKVPSICNLKVNRCIQCFYE